jgi:DNA-binding MarR family transcriptional regulator
MLTRLPDMTRMLDRLEKAGWVERQRSTEDRRVINVMIQQQGKELLAQLDQPVLQLHARQFQNLESQELTELNRLLTKSYKGSA